MADNDEMVSEFEAQQVENSTGWKRLLTLAMSACVVTLVVVATFYLVATLTHRPRIVYPPGVSPEVELRVAPGASPEVREQLERFLKTYPLPTCTVGKKYGALCQDGEVTYDGSESACSEHGGVKEWIECR